VDWKKLLEELPAGVAVLDENFKVVMLNRRIVEKAGLRAESVKNPLQTVHPEDLSKAVDAFRKISMGRYDEVEYPLLLRVVRKGGYQWNELRWRVVEDEGKKYYLIVFTDVTERVEMQKRIESLLEYVRLLNSILRHDILNILTTISSYAELLDEEFNRKFLDKIKEAVSKGVSLIKKVRELELSTDESLKPYDLRSVIEESAKGYDVEVNVEGNAVVYANDSIYSVFENLIGNSVKHGGASRIDVKIETSDMVYVTYKDNGAGIPENVKDKVFERGFSTTGSTGLGLFIVKKLMESYGGDIRIEKSGKEAEFILSFPVVNRT